MHLPKLRQFPSVSFYDEFWSVEDAVDWMLTREPNETLRYSNFEIPANALLRAPRFRVRGPRNEMQNRPRIKLVP